MQTSEEVAIQFGNEPLRFPGLVIFSAKLKKKLKKEIRTNSTIHLYFESVFPPTGRSSKAVDGGRRRMVENLSEGLRSIEIVFDPIK